MTFRSKVDTWLALVLFASAAASLAGAALALRSGSGWLLPVLIAGLGSALPLWILQSTTYSVGNGQVLVRSGPFRWRIAASGITRIAPTRSSVSGPALSLDRLRIEYQDGKKSLMVSPREQAQFVRAVEAARTGA